MTRAVDLGLALLGVEQLYRGARSIYSSVFEGEDFSLRLRWSNLESTWGYPHRLTHEGLRAINQFAEAELGALIVSGRGSQHTSLPLTEAQRAQAKARKEAEKSPQKRAAAAQASLTEQPTAAATIIDGVRSVRLPLPGLPRARPGRPVNVREESGAGSNMMDSRRTQRTGS